jgi:3-dehydroquinate dehydratase-2
MLRLLVLHGPNLNLLGTRERSIYGTTSLAEIDRMIGRFARDRGLTIETRQSNEEGELVTWIQQAKGRFDGLVINPAGYTHTSVAIPDAIAAVAIPTVEVHLSNIHQREEFRHKSFVAGIALAQISGFGPRGYLLALEGLAEHLKSVTKKPVGKKPAPSATGRKRTPRA